MVKKMSRAGMLAVLQRWPKSLHYTGVAPRKLHNRYAYARGRKVRNPVYSKGRFVGRGR